MVDGKWIEGLGSLLSIPEAARLALQARLDVVRFYLPMAMKDADRDPEHVHRLRVGTRRGGAALRIFATALPEKVYDKARKVLRSIRRAAGEARDWDVFAQDMRTRLQRISDKDRPGISFLLGYASGHRDAAQVDLLKAGTKHEEELREILATAIRTVRQPETAETPVRFEELGIMRLRELTQELNWAAARNLDDYEQLHQVRILGKQLRYAMEIFAGCFPPELREVIYPRVEEMQEVLGLANDSHVAYTRLTGLRDRYRLMWPKEWEPLQPGVESLIRFHRRRLPKQRELFLEWWKQWQTVDMPFLSGLMSRKQSLATPIQQHPVP